MHIFVIFLRKSLQMCIFFITFVGFLCAHRCSRTLVQRICIMKIALIGYGKMGRMIESVALSSGHEIVCVIDPLTSPQTFDSPAFRSADVAIEFTRPEAAEQNVRAALAQGVPVVSGTTGWDVAALQASLNTQRSTLNELPGVIWSSNYSIGVNILFAVNKYLAQLLHNTGGYQPSITEVHHIHKLDAPSGTAKTLAENISPTLFSKEGDNTRLNGDCVGNVPITSIREGEVPGIHEVRWESEADILTLRHEAKSRQGFALGAVLAAEWLRGKTGWHSMNEVLGLEGLKV